MASKLGDAYVDVRADTSQFSKDLDKGVTKATQGATKEMGALGSATEKVGSLAKVAIAGLAVGALAKVGQFAGDSIRAYSDLNESLNAVNVSFGENAAEVTKLGEAAARNLGLSNAEFNTLSVSVSAFTEKIAEGLGQSVPETLDTLTTRVADFASVMNLDVDEAFEKFRSGLAGESEPLRQFGIDVSAATVEQVALAEGIIEVGEEMTEADKVTARYLAIMEQTEKVAGDFANTAGDLANSQRIANAEMENAKARIGEVLVPFAQLTTKVQLLAAKGLGIASLAFQNMTGDISNAEYAISAFETHTGATADSLAAAVTINQKYGTTFDELFTSMTFADGALAPLTASQIAYLESIGLTTPEIEALNTEIETYIGAADTAGRTSTGALVGFENLSGGVKTLGEETAITTGEIETQTELLRGLTDPLFNAMTASRDAAIAQSEYDTVLANSESTIAEQDAALGKLWEAQLELIDAQGDLEALGPDWKEQFRERGLAMGFPLQEINKIIERIDYLNAVAHEGIEIRVDYRAGTEPNLRGGARAHGGPVSAGSPYLVGEQGRELFVPTVNGTIIPNNQIGTAGGITANITVNLTGGATRSDARLVSDEIMVGLKRLSEARTVA